MRRSVEVAVPRDVARERRGGHARLKRYHRPALVCVASTVLASCTVGPDFVSPPAPEISSYLPPSVGKGSVDKQKIVAELDLPGQWWRTFHSRALTTLVERALKQNADIQAAQAALRAARENGISQRSAFYPQVSSGFNTTGGKASADVSPPLSTDSQYYSLSTAQVTVSYQPDLFGLNRRLVESADALTRAQRFQVEATFLTLSSNVVMAALTEASLRAQIDATRKIIEIEKRLVEILNRQRGLGQVAVSDVLIQQAALEQAEQTLPSLEKQLGTQRDLLTALCGQYANDEIPEKFELKSFHLPSQLPVSIPSTLVAHRPDVRAAEANLQSASALIGVAEANRLPLVALSAEVGSNPSNLMRLFAPSSGFYTLAGSVAQTVFDGGNLLHKQKQAEANFDQAYAQYRGSAVAAFQNVADSLRAIQADARGEALAKRALATAGKSLDIVRNQIKFGQVGGIVLLTTEQTYMQANLSLIQASSARFSDTVALFQALGGGWWNRNDVETPPPYTLLDAVR